MFGLVDKYKFDKSDVPAKMYFTCPRTGRTYDKVSSVSLKSTTYEAAHFEPMVGVFSREACAADRDLPDCLREVTREYQDYLGDMDGARNAFAQCFADGKGTIEKK